MNFATTGYELSREWFNWSFENPEKVTPNHTALYFFCIEHCNRLGWKEKFGLPMEMAKDAIGIKNYRTYSNTFNDLVSWNFIKLVQKSRNQYSATVIALVKNTKANTKALDKAMHKHGQKQYRSIVGVVKPITFKPLNLETELGVEFFNKLNEKWISIFQKWINYRQSINAPIVDFKSSFEELETLSEKNLDDAEIIVKKSIDSGWKGLFPKNKRQPKKPETIILPKPPKQKPAEPRANITPEQSYESLLKYFNEQKTLPIGWQWNKVFIHMHQNKIFRSGEINKKLPLKSFNDVAQKEAIFKHFENQ